jgi:hypothetical protein
MSEAAKNRTPEHLAKIGAAHKGKSIPREVRDRISKKVSETLKAQWAAGKYATRQLVPWNKELGKNA